MSNNIQIASVCVEFVKYHFRPLEDPPIACSPVPGLFPFINHTLQTAQLPPAVPFGALFLLKRLKTRIPTARCSSGQGLFVAALVIASKTLLDCPYSNDTWVTILDNTMSLAKINELERHMLRYLAWSVTIHGPSFYQFLAEVESMFGA